MQHTPLKILSPLALAIALGPLLGGDSAYAAGNANTERDYQPIEDFTPHVVGGQPVAPGQWPDTAGVFFSGELGCTGTLVAPTVVLTAGHCIDDSIDKVVLNATDAARNGESIRVSQRIAYPNWESTLDVGILVLEQPSSVKPRLIASQCVIDGYYKNGAPVELVGYGATDVQGEVYGTVLLGAATTITDADCQPGSGCNASVSPGGELIAGGTGVDSCFGDSGGPIYLRTDVGDYLLGATSRGLETSATPCGGGGIYTRADAVMDWIESEAGVQLTRSDCSGFDGTDDPDVDDDGFEPDGDPNDPRLPEDDGQEGGANGDVVQGGCNASNSSSTGGLWFFALGLAMFLRRKSTR